MDDVETGYYSELSSSDMLNTAPNPVNNLREPPSDPPGPSEPLTAMEELPLENTVEEELISNMNEIYSLDRGKTKLYKEFLKLYSDSEEGKFVESDSFERGQTRKKLLLWLLIIVLISNPILGGYNLHHFTNYFNNFSQTQLTQVFPQEKNDRQVTEKKWYQFSFTNSNRVENLATENENDVLDVVNPSIIEFKRICDEISVRIRRYSFYEVFGEIIFGIFSLVLMSICKLPCNNGNSIRFMMPMLFILYMLIYRFLAIYILFNTMKIGFYSLVSFNPKVLQWTPYFLVYLLRIRNVDPYNSETLGILRKLYLLDSWGIKMLWLFCLENVHITFSEALELFTLAIKLIISLIRKKVFGRSDLNFYSSNEGGFRLFRSCFSRDTFSSSDPHEKYIHSLYNYASDIGTYLKNIDVGDYSQGLDDLTNKFKNRKLI